MVPAFLLPESTAREDGLGPEIALGAHKGKPLMLTLGINRILEQESLEVTVLGSSDGQKWETVATFPPKCYCGTYCVTVDLSRHREISVVRAHWKMSRWDSRAQQPLFGFYLYLEELRMRVAGAA